jgi:hypothetical protein
MTDARRGHEKDNETLESRMIRKGQVRFGEGWLEKDRLCRHLVSHLLYIVWDATEVIEFSRKHTANVHDALGEIRQAIESLVQKRDQRRDGFVKVIQRAMETTLGSDAEEVQKALGQNGIPRTLAKEAIDIAVEKGRFTVFAMVDALTRIAGKIVNAGDRTQVDQKAAGLLALAV